MKKVEKGHPLFPGGIVSWEWIKKEGHSGNVEIENLKKIIITLC